MDSGFGAVQCSPQGVPDRRIAHHSGKLRVFVAGHNGLVGSALVRRLTRHDDIELILRSRAELDLTDSVAVERFFSGEKPHQVYLAAARVGGIVANSTQSAEFIHENLAIQTNVIHSAWRNGVSKFLFLGSSCIYPKFSEQPMRESCLLTGPLEYTNEMYAVAKIAGLKMCQAYRRQYGFDAVVAMPTNLYGPNDNFDLNNSHVLPALVRKFSDAADSGTDIVEIWGTGLPRREFLHVDDLADACRFLMDNYRDIEPVNVGWGMDLTIAELASKVAAAVGYSGKVIFNTDRPDGMPRKLLETSRMEQLGWRPRISLDEGLRTTVNWYRRNDNVRGGPGSVGKISAAETTVHA
ncbi:MAG: GDP-L-fucose synthase [Pseudomonadota bacterium]